MADYIPDTYVTSSRFHFSREAHTHTQVQTILINPMIIPNGLFFFFFELNNSLNSLMAYSQTIATSDFKSTFFIKVFSSQAADKDFIIIEKINFFINFQKKIIYTTH